MRDFRKRGKNGPTSFLILCVALVIVLILAVFFARAAWGMYVKFTVASRGNDAAQKELAELEASYAKMSAAVADLSSQRGEEGEIRQRFGVAKPGEGAIEIVRTEGSTTPVAPDTGNPFMRILRSLIVW